MADFGDAVAELERIAAAASAGAFAASDGMASLFRSTARGEMRVGHPLHTQTPSPPGEPPAWISGNLRNSFVNTEPASLGDATWLTMSGPTVRYARIHELGGQMTAHNPSGYMWWQQGPGHWHASRSHRLPPRPYMKPAQKIVDSGAAAETAAAAFGAVIAAAAGA